MKRIELSLSESQHQYLLTVASHDKSFRSLQALARDCLMDGLTRAAAKDLGMGRTNAISALVNAGNNVQRRKP